MTEFSTLPSEIISIARQAGEAIMQVYSGEIEISRKQDDSPLTHADMAAHHIIEAALKRLTPELPILSEESASIDFSIRSTWRRYWLVDPLDGTREFIKRNGEFTVNIALIEDSRPVMGVVYAPAKELLYYASEHQGAFKLGDGGQAPIAIKARALNLDRLTVAGSRSHSNIKMQAFLRNLSEPELLSLGSSLKICLVAEGKADVYPRFGPTSEWDTAAAQCVLEEAGGRLANKQGVPLRYNTKDSLLNPEFFACGATPHDWSQYLE